MVDKRGHENEARKRGAVIVGRAKFVGGVV
jgi:hypothetical protein